MVANLAGPIRRRLTHVPQPDTDLIVVLVIVLLIFGPKRLPGLGKQLGTGLREFKESITGEHKDDEAAEQPELTSEHDGPGGCASGDAQNHESAEVASPERRS